MSEQIEIEPKRDEKGKVIKGIWVRKGLIEEINEIQLDIEINKVMQTIENLNRRLEFLRRLKNRIEEVKRSIEAK